MLNVTNLLCGTRTGNETLRYGHTRRSGGCAQDIPRPVVAWAITRACNLRCVHCYAAADATPAKGELTFTEGLQLLEDLRAFKVPAVLFTGGEPLARPDALDLMEHAVEIGLNTTLSTNGTLIDEPTADRLAEIGLRYAGISLDGTEPLHDRLRAKKGAFAASMRAIRLCRERGIRVGVRFTVHQLNYMDLDAIFDLCLENGVQRLCVYHLVYSGRGGKLRKIDLNHAQTRQVVDRIFQRTQAAHEAGHELEVLTVGNHSDAPYLLMCLERTDKQRYQQVKRLLAGTGGNRSGCNIASIDPVGNVHYDQFSWHYSCGNVREQPFSKIWGEPRDPRLRILRQRRPHLPRRCQVCRFLGLCNGNNRTRAEAATGDWLGPDPACYIRDEDLGLIVPAECVMPNLHELRHTGIPQEAL